MHEVEMEAKVSKLEKFKNFLSSLRQEIRVITWPTQKELKKYTKLVILSTLGCGFCVYVVDIASKYFLDSLRKLVSLFLT